MLPVRIKETSTIKEGSDIFHFVKNKSRVGFSPEKHFTFKQLVSEFCDVTHSNQRHFLLFKIIAMASYFQRINVRVSSNPEFGKDSTFEVMAYLTNQVAVFDKPRTMAKLEYGVVNRVLMVNELVPKSEEEKRSIGEFLLSIGSMKPIYQKTTRGSAAFNTRDVYDISNFSLIICYNNMQDIAETDKENYFDLVFGRNVLERFIPLKMSGTIDVHQFIHKTAYTEEIDEKLLRIARTIEWYKQNWQSELNPWAADISGASLSGRQKKSLQQIFNFLNLYSESEHEFRKLCNELLECHYDYNRMVAGNNLLSDFQKPEVKVVKEEELVVVEESIDEGAESPPRVLGMPTEPQPPLAYIREHGPEVRVEDFLEVYTEATMNKLLSEGEIVEMPAHILRVLE